MVFINTKKISASVLKTNSVTADAAVKNGFSLLELLIAMAIASISFMAIIPLLVNSMGINKSMVVGNKARDIAVQKVEDLMAMPRDLIVNNYLGTGTTYSNSSTPEYITEQGVVKTAKDSTTIFTRTFSVTEVSGVLTDPIPVVITSVVQYTYNGQSKTKSFSTMWSF